MSESQIPTAEDTDLLHDVLHECQRGSAKGVGLNHTKSELFEISFEKDDIQLIRTTHNSNTGITLFSEGRKGSASFNGIEKYKSDAAILTAQEAMEACTPDPANCLAPGTHEDYGHTGFEPADRGEMAQSVLGFMEKSRKLYPRLCMDRSTYSFLNYERAYLNSEGSYKKESRSGYRLNFGFTGKDQDQATSFSYVTFGSFKPIENFLSIPSVSEAINNTLKSFNPRKIPRKFTGTLILTPSSLGTLAGSLLQSLSGYRLMAKTTPFAKRQGEKIAHESFTLKNAPNHSEFLNGSFFDGAGVPTQEIDFIREGVLNEFNVDYYCSQKLNRAQTAGMTNLMVEAGDKSYEDIIRSTEEGVLMTRFSGGNPNSNLDFSGVAKTSFYIKNGEIQYPLIETMVSGNFQELIQNIQGISKETVNDGASRFPYVSCEGAVFSSE